MSQLRTYFAAGKPEEVAASALKKSDSFFNTLRANAYLEKLAKMWQAYHGAYSNDVGYGHTISFSGEQGELVQLPVNQFRNLAQHIYVMVTSNRPVLEARAVNTDYKSQAQTYLANGILDYYMRERKLEDALKKATEISIVLGAGFVKMEWNATAGEAYDVDDETGEMVYEGDIQFSTLTPFDVVVDGTKESWDNDWVLVRSFQNRYNLMAKYPEQAEKIQAMQSKSDSAVYRLALWSNDDTDDIPVYEFYHKKTEALPDGRYVLFCDSETILLDAKLPYAEIPIYRIAPSDILGTPYGYSPMFDILPIQEGLNALYSTVMTNQNAFGVQNVFVPRGADLNVNTIEGAMNIIEGNAKPEALNLTQTPAEVFRFIDMLNQASETISGVNSVARGNPEASLKSGAALALVQSMAIQFISGLQQSYVRLIEDCGTSTINMLKTFAKTPKVIALVGKNNRSYLKEFTGDKLDAINRVIVDVGNPLARTLAGRVQMAEQMIQMGIVKNPIHYFQVINTGRLEPMFENEMDTFLLTQSENESLLAGEPVNAYALDEHKLHIQEHKKVFNDPELRKDRTLLQNANAHIQQHIDLLRQTNPDLLQLLDQQPLNPPTDATESSLPPGPQNPGNGGGGGGPGGPSILPVMQLPSGNPRPGEQISGPGIENGHNLPQLPTVNPHLLTNPQAQANSLGNLKK